MYVRGKKWIINAVGNKINDEETQMEKQAILFPAKIEENKLKTYVWIM